MGFTMKFAPLTRTFWCAMCKQGAIHLKPGGYIWQFVYSVSYFWWGNSVKLKYDLKFQCIWKLIWFFSVLTMAKAFVMSKTAMNSSSVLHPGVIVWLNLDFSAWFQHFLIEMRRAITEKWIFIYYFMQFSRSKSF